MSGFFSSLKSLASGAAKYQKDDSEEDDESRMYLCQLTPQSGESGFIQWLDAMKKVARLPGGIPSDFRKQLWLTLAERHLDQRGVDWKEAEKMCFHEKTSIDDEEIITQIVKDLHRTGCSLFCGAAGRDNQAVLRRVLLGFARWNKSVGYCQGLNVLAALILQVTDRAEGLALKIMIYLIEGVLPEGYYADNLRGMAIDMAVFCDLMRIKLPKLSKHLEALQNDNKDKATGSGYEPPLTNVFTMQWFLTLFCHCLPQKTVFRIWDLIYLEGSDVLLKTALAIWNEISDRVMTVTSADEFYSIMGVLTREMLEFTDTNNLITTIVNMGSLHGVTDLREKHRYNITPWARPLSDSDETDAEDNDNRLELTTPIFGISQRSKKDRILQQMNPIHDKDKLALDISTLKNQYAKLRERQRQAHIILSAAVSRPSVVATTTSQAMNHLLVGKGALVSSKSRQLSPLSGTVPSKAPLQSRAIFRDKQTLAPSSKWQNNLKEIKTEPLNKNTNDNMTGEVELSLSKSPEVTSSKYSRDESVDSDSGSGSTELCDDPDRLSDSDDQTSLSDCYVLPNDNTSFYASTDKSNVTDNTELIASLNKITCQIGKLSEDKSDEFEIKSTIINDEFHSFKSTIKDEENKLINEIKSPEESKYIVRDDLNVEENFDKSDDFFVEKNFYSSFKFSNEFDYDKSPRDGDYLSSCINTELKISESFRDSEEINFIKLDENDKENIEIVNFGNEIESSKEELDYNQDLLMRFDSIEKKVEDCLEEEEERQEISTEIKLVDYLSHEKDEEEDKKSKDTVQSLLYRPSCSIPMTVDSLLINTDSFEQSPNITNAVSPFHSIFNPYFEMTADNTNSSSPETHSVKSPPPVFSLFDHQENSSDNSPRLSTEAKLEENSFDEFIYQRNKNTSSIISRDITSPEENYKSNYLVNNKSDLSKKRPENPSVIVNIPNDCPETLDHLLKEHDTNKLLERSWTSLDRQYDDKKNKNKLDETTTTKIQKCSSDILDDLRHLEACEESNLSDASILRKTGPDWNDLKSLEARRQDTFSDSASGFSQAKLDLSLNNPKIEPRKTYKICPRINIDENSDSILNNYSKNFGNDGEESKLGVWTKVKPRRHRENRRNSDRALKIIQENSVILHKILTGQARKSIPDLEDISEEITISPINEEISKIFSPLLEQMGLNEHEINEELSRINIENFDQMKLTAGSEFDSKINDELSKLSLIDDNEVINISDLDEILGDDTSSMREARIDKQINDELSKLTQNYNDIENKKYNIDLLKNLTSTSSNDIDLSDLSSLSDTNVFSIDTPSDYNDHKTNYDLIQDSSILASNKYQSIFPHDSADDFSLIKKYDYPYLAAESNSDIRNELEKLNKISSSSNIEAYKISSPVESSMIHHPGSRILPHLSKKIYSPQADLDVDEITGSHQQNNTIDRPKTFDYLETIKPFVRSPQIAYDTNNESKNIIENKSSGNRQILSKETLEFRVKYGFEDETDDLRLDYRTNRKNQGTRYYENDPSVPQLHRSCDKNNSTYSSSNSSRYISSDDNVDDNTGIDTRLSEIKKTHDNKLYGTIFSDNNSTEIQSYLTRNLSPNCKFMKHDIVDFINPLTLSSTSPIDDISADKRINNLCKKNYDDENICGVTTNYREEKFDNNSSIACKKIDGIGDINLTNDDNIDSSKNNFNPFPKRNNTRKPNELGLKLGLYSPSSSNINESKRA